MPASQSCVYLLPVRFVSRVPVVARPAPRSTLSVLAMQRDAWGWACVLFTLYHACDNTDGKHARRTGKSSKFGHVRAHAVDATL